MRYLILIVSLALASAALAEEKPKPITITKPVDKATPILMAAPSPSSPGEMTDAKEKANKTKSSAQPDDAGHANASSRSAALHAEGVVHRDIAARGAENNGGSAGTRAQDYNSSRSNTTSLRENDAADLDGDGRPDLVVCRNGVDDDCNGTDLDELPANHNTTRSNK